MTLLGIVGPSILAAAALRRWIVPIAWSRVLLFLLLTLAFLNGAVFSSRLPVPVDEVARGYPWRGIFPEVSRARNPLTNDTVKLFLPWMQVVREELAHGRAPLWNRYSFSGYPLLGNGESAPFSPLFLATLFVPLPKQIVAMAGLKLFLSLIFMDLLLREEGCSAGASLFGACTFAFCTFQTVYLYYSTTAVTALLPAAIFAALTLVRRPAASRAVLLAIVVGTLLANGHPESVLHIAVACAMFLLIENGAAWHRWIVPLHSVIGGVVISSPAWIPVLSQVLQSERYAQARRSAAVVFPYEAAWALIAPNHFGNPVHGDWHWVMNYALFASSYAGLLPLALFGWAAVSTRTTRRDRILAAVALLLFVLAMNWTLLGHTMNLMPPFSVSANDKLRFVSVFIVAFIAARALRRFAWLAALLVIIDLFYYNIPFNALVESKYFRPRLRIMDVLKAYAPAEPFRIVGRDWVLLPNASAQYGFEDIRGSDPMESRSYAEFFRTFSVQEAGTDVKRVQDVDRPELDFLNVRFLLAEPDVHIGGRWHEMYRSADGTLYENSASLRRFFSTDGGVIGRIEMPDSKRFRFKVESATPATIRSSQPSAGWSVRVDGALTNVFPGIFVSFVVPPGSHMIDVTYRPVAFRASLLLMIFGAIVWWNTLRRVLVVTGPSRQKLFPKPNIS